MPAVSTESSSAIRSRSSDAIEAASAFRASAYSCLRSFASAVAWRAVARVACSWSRLARAGPTARITAPTRSTTRGPSAHPRPSIRRRVLSGRLARLVTEGLLRKFRTGSAPAQPGRVPLTGKGLDLYPVLMALMAGATGKRWPGRSQVLLRHRDCGQPVGLQLSCQAMHVLESAREVTAVPGPGARKVA